MHTVLPNGQIVYEEDYSCIIQPQNGKGGIYIGNLEAAQNFKTLKKHGIRAVLTAAKGIDLAHSKTEVPFYLQVPGEDREGFDLTRYFPQSINFIRDALQTTNIMVHCLAGVSRSVCLVLAYFIKQRGFSYDEAYNLVKARRNIIHPNEGFIVQLRKFQTQVRLSGGSPSKYDNIQNRIQSYDTSPSKRRYDYCFQKGQDIETRNNPEIYSYQNQRGYFASPTKRATIDSYAPTYQSPSKKSFQQLVVQNYESRNKSILNSPTKKRFNQTTRQVKDTFIYEEVNLNRFQSYNEVSERESRFDMKHISPDRRRPNLNVQQRGRSNSNMDLKMNTTNIEAKRLFGNYDRLRHTSAAELSQELDNKIAAIREKYSQYSKNQANKSRRMTARDSDPRVNNYMDENDVGLSTTFGLRRMTSDYDGVTTTKFNTTEYGIIKNNLDRTNTGLGLRRLNSMREGCY